MNVPSRVKLQTTDNDVLTDLADIVETDRGRAAAIVATQNDYLCTLAEMRQWWIDRASAQANLAMELGNAIAAARSVPEVAAAYQLWMVRHMDMLAADGRELVALEESFADSGRRLLCADART